jgi:hypothetical protein
MPRLLNAEYRECAEFKMQKNDYYKTKEVVDPKAIAASQRREDKPKSTQIRK